MGEYNRFYYLLVCMCGYMPPDRWSRDVKVCGIGSEVEFVVRLWVLAIGVVSVFVLLLFGTVLM